MQNKIPYVLFMILLCSCNRNVNLNSQEIDDLNGTWIPNFSYEWWIEHPDERTVFSEELFSWGSGKTMSNTTLYVDLEKLKIFEPGVPYEIEQVDKNKKGEIIIRVTLDGSPLDMTFSFIDDDTVVRKRKDLEGHDRTDMWEASPIWHKISGPKKITDQKGIINDNRVRLRTAPTLKSKTWAYLNKKEMVEIIDRSKEKEKIEKMEAYWYKVRLEDTPDGWVYGGFIDVIAD